MDPGTRQTNCSLITRLRSGRTRTSYWQLSSIKYDLSMLVNEGVLRGTRGMRPVRLQEQTLSLSLLFPVSRERDWLNFQSLVREHWRYSLDRGASSPMLFYYQPINKLFSGFILNLPIGYQVKQTSFNVDLRMKVVTRSTRAVSLVTQTNPFVPTNSDVSLRDWYRYVPHGNNPLSSLLAGWYANIYPDTGEVEEERVRIPELPLSEQNLLDRRDGED